MSRIITNESNTSTNTSNIATLQTSTNTLQTQMSTVQSTQVTQGTNITNLSSSVTTVQNQLNNKSNINNPSFTGTFQTPSITDNGSSVVMSSVTSVPSLTLNGTDLTTTLNSKADKANPSFTGTATFNTITTQSLVDNGNLTIRGNTNIGDAAGDTLTVRGTTKFHNQVLLSDDTNLGVRLGNLGSSITTINNDITSINSTLSAKANDSAVVHLTGNEIVSGTKTFTATPKIGTSDVATVQNIDDRFTQLMGGVVPETLDTLNEISAALQTNDSSINAILSTMVTLGSTQTINSVKTFSVSPVVPTATQGDNSGNTASTSYVDTGISNLSTSVASTYQPISSMSNYLTTSNATSTYQPISSMSNYLTTSNATSTYRPISSMSNYLTTSNATSTYQPISSMSTYPQLTSSNTFSNTNEFSSDLVTNKMVEKYTTATVSGNALSINFASVTSNVFSISPSSATNIALTITNIPTTRTALYSFTFLINTSTNKNYISTINVNGSSITMRGMGGLSNISVNASSTLTIQNIYVQMNNASVASVITNVTSCF